MAVLRWTTYRGEGSPFGGRAFWWWVVVGGEVEGDDVKVKEGSRELKLKLLHYKTVFLN